MMGKCPHCNVLLDEVTVEPVKIRSGLKYAYAGVGYYCSRCRSVLSVGIDPVALQADLVAAIEKVLLRHKD
jgi:uncharacterized protein with PIN domain